MNGPDAWKDHPGRRPQARGHAICMLQDVSRHYHVRKGFFSAKKSVVKALDRVSLSVGQGEVLGLVGESGCGKSTLAKVALGLEPPTAGRVLFQGQDISSLDRKGLKTFRRKVQMVFQDPFSSLNPKKTIFQILSEPLKIHALASGTGLHRRVRELLEAVGMDSPGIEKRYPHEFSGGQRQRICIARALATDPLMVVADEPTSALDVSVQAQIITLLMELHRRKGISFLFISHDLPLVQFVSNRIAVMYRGVVVEIMPRRLFGLEAAASRSSHPYTEYLTSAIPVPDPGLYRRSEAGGLAKARQTRGTQGVEDLDRGDASFFEGCVFVDRCPEAANRCKTTRPELRELSEGHFVACLRR